MEISNKTKEEIIFELLLSLNRRDSGYIVDRVNHAIKQYQQLEEELSKLKYGNNKDFYC